MVTARSSQSLSELLLLMLRHLSKDKSTEFTDNPAVLHSAFYDLKEAFGGEIRALGDMHFITAGAYPYSPELRDALNTLQQVGAISRENPSYERFTLKDYEGVEEWVTGSNRALELSGHLTALNSAVQQLSGTITVR